MRQAWSFRSCGIAALVAAVCLGGCSVPNAVNPVAWYRSLSGADKNDALDKDQSNQQNLEAGGKEPYPNLADVPNAPDNALSEKNRDALQKSLGADRSNAQYSDEQLRAGSPPPGTVAPLPPSPAIAQAEPSNGVAAAKPSGPAAPPPAITPAPPPPAQAAAPPPPPAPAPAPRAAVAAAPVPPPPPAPAPVAATQQTAAAAPPSQAASSPPKVEPPAESSLATPTIAKLPQGEMPAPPPPLPSLKPPSVANRPPPNAVASLASGKRRESSSSVAVASIAFANGSAALTDRDRDRLSEIAAMQHEQGGDIRIVGHAESAKGGDLAQQELASLRLAHNRAKAVAQVLSGEGIASRSIDVEAAPTRAGDTAAANAEIYLEH